MSLPNTYTDKNETVCCPVPNVGAWDDQEMQFEDQYFIRLYMRSFLFMPMNMGAVMKKLFCRQYGFAIRKDWSMERLSVRRKGIYNPEPCRQDFAGLASFRRNTTTLTYH